MADVGMIQKINIGHDCTSAGWYLDRVRIRKPADNRDAILPGRTGSTKSLISLNFIGHYSLIVVMVHGQSSNGSLSTGMITS